jgi:hypothetical protein
MKLKNNVIMAGLHPVMRPALIQADKIWTYLDQELVVTSALDGEHSASSLHYFGYALDFRIRYFEEKERWQAWSMLSERLERLDSDYSVILEEDHIHVEYRGTIARLDEKWNF